MLAVGFAIVTATGCQELPRTGWPVVRGASPGRDEEPAAFVKAPADDDNSESAFDRDGLATDAGRGRRFIDEDPAEPGYGSSRFISRDRSPLIYDEDLDSDSPSPQVTDEPFGFGGQPPTADDTDQPSVAEIEHEQFRFFDDVKALPGLLWTDAKSLVTWQNAIVLGAAAGAAVAIRDNLDQRVRQETAEHPSRWGEGSTVLRQFGEYTYQVPVLAGVYAAGLWTQDEKLHEFSLAVLSAYGLSATATVAIKGITNTTRPTDQFENGHYGFPSYHTSSTFAIAGCLDEYYGWKAGVPAYVLASLVGWSRIDQREHDLSDVLFGAVLGVVIGKTVAAAHLDRQSDLKIAPYYDVRNQATGISVEKRY
ncbi:MAG TPA: phosphatase PAP2 family protein [Planctomycetaceae bacterium]